MSNFVVGWYLIYTRPRSEKKVAQRLSDAKIDFYLPTMKISRTWHDRKKTIESPLFPSYVFIYLRQLQDYYAGLAADGALYYVRFGKQIARVNELIISNLKLVVNEGKALEVSSDYFSPSQTLMITEGSLSGLSCEVVRHKDKEMLLVRVNLLNRCILIDMPVNYVVKA